jgi:hypothetical protein
LLLLCRSWQNIHQHTFGFLGFWWQHCNEERRHVRLAVFRDDFLSFLRYISMLKAKGRSGDYMSKNCHCAVRHLHHLKSTSPTPYTATQLQRHTEQLEMLDTLKWQLRKITHHTPFNYQALMAGGRWKDAPDIISFIEQQKEATCTQVKVRWLCAGTHACRRCRAVPPAASCVHGLPPCCVL